MASQIISLGYERRDVEELISILQSLGVTKLLDIRERPLSRKQGFSKKALSDRLGGAGICYKHIQEAGNPYHKSKADLQKCLHLYSIYLEDNPQIIEIIESNIGSETSVALLCYERKHHHCHRSILIEKIRQPDNEIELVLVE